VTTATFDRLLRTPVTLLTRTGSPTPDEFGEQTDDVDEVETFAHLQQDTAAELHGGAVQDTAWRVWLPADAPAKGWDALRLEDGTVLELDGDAWPVENPRAGGVHHVEARVRRVD
jgi:hypothetical protein